MYRFFFVLLAFTMLIGCGDDTNETAVDNQSDQLYYPLEIGKYWNYKVDSLIFSNGGSIIDTSRLYIRYDVLAKEIRPFDTIFTIQKSIASNVQFLWSAEKIFNIVKSDNSIISNEDNLGIVLLELPFSINSTWDNLTFDPKSVDVEVGGEIVNVYTKWSASCVAVDTTLVSNQITFTDVAKISDSDFEDFINLRKRDSYYAYGIGLVYREESIFDTQCFNVNPDCVNIPWEEKAEKGYYTRIELIEYGN